MLTYAKLALAVFKFARWLTNFLERKSWISEGERRMIAKWEIENARLTIERYELDKTIADIPDDDTDEWLRKRGSEE